jgi:prepilin-type N-terminal cleavage/methylation domain-containing protein
MPIHGETALRASARRGFSLMELMTSVAIVGVLSAIAYPLYSGYVDTTRVNVVKDHLRAVHMQQQEYFAMYASYYATGVACDADRKAEINANLFAGQNVLQEPNVTFCITQVTPTDFTAQAVYEESDGGTTTYTVDESGTTNF